MQSCCCSCGSIPEKLVENLPSSGSTSAPDGLDISICILRQLDLLLVQEKKWKYFDRDCLLRTFSAYSSDPEAGIVYCRFPTVQFAVFCWRLLEQQKTSVVEFGIFGMATLQPLFFLLLSALSVCAISTLKPYAIFSLLQFNVFLRFLLYSFFNSIKKSRNNQRSYEFIDESEGDSQSNEMAKACPFSQKIFLHCNVHLAIWNAHRSLPHKCVTQYGEWDI